MHAPDTPSRLYRLVSLAHIDRVPKFVDMYAQGGYKQAGHCNQPNLTCMHTSAANQDSSNLSNQRRRRQKRPPVATGTWIHEMMASLNYTLLGALRTITCLLHILTFGEFPLFSSSTCFTWGGLRTVSNRVGCAHPCCYIMTHPMELSKLVT